MVEYLDCLSAFVEGVTYETLSDSARAAAKDVILDTFGAMLAGSWHPENARLAALVAERSRGGRATLAGHPLKADAMLATLANATAGISFDVDEGNRWGGGHPGIHVVTPALAVAEELGADGRRLLAAVVAGYEVTSRIGGGARLTPNVHVFGTMGTLGAAVAVAKLHGYDRRGLREVINLAASMSPANSWTPCFEGVTIRNLYAGRATLHGILAVHLHRCGYTGLADGPADIFGTILAESFDPAKVVDGLGERYRIEQGYFKLHACCLFNHPTLDAVSAIRRQARFEHDDVEHVAVTSLAFGERMTERAPATALAAKFSIPYAVAASIVTGRTDIAAFVEPHLSDPRVRALAARVEVKGDPAITMQRHDGPLATVTITLRDGRSLSHATEVVEGDADNPVPRARLVEKFLSLAAPSLGEPRARRLVGAVADLEASEDVTAITSFLRP